MKNLLLALLLSVLISAGSPTAALAAQEAAGEFIPMLTDISAHSTADADTDTDTDVDADDDVDIDTDVDAADDVDIDTTIDPEIDINTELTPQPATFWQLGESWNYTLQHEVTVTNSSPHYIFDIRITVPMNDTLHGEESPYSVIKAVEYDPIPASIETGANGQRYAVYHIDALAGNSSLVLKQSYNMQVSSINYKIDYSTLSEKYTEQELSDFARWLQPEEGINSSSMLIHSFVANTLGSSTTNPYLKARMLFSAVNLALTYSDEEQDQSAVEVLKRGSGNCEGFANLYLAALRAAGIPARQQSGYLYQPEKHINDEYVDMELGHIMFDALRHTWVEFYLSGLGWVHADPTFTYTYEINGQPIRFINWNYFANISNDRRYFYFRTGSTSTDAIAYSCVGNGLDVSFNAYMQSGPPPLPFSDIRGHWAASAISYCYEQGLITGMNEFCFMPEDTLTRAMFITMLGRLFEGCGGSISAENSTAAQFVDVDTNAY